MTTTTDDTSIGFSRYKAADRVLGGAPSPGPSIEPARQCKLLFADRAVGLSGSQVPWPYTGTFTSDDTALFTVDTDGQVVHVWEDGVYAAQFQARMDNGLLGDRLYVTVSASSSYGVVSGNGYREVGVSPGGFIIASTSLGPTKLHAGEALNVFAVPRYATANGQTASGVLTIIKLGDAAGGGSSGASTHFAYDYATVT